MLRRLSIEDDKRTFIGAALMCLGVAALYNSFVFVNGRHVGDSALTLDLAWWLWPMSNVTILAGMIVLPPGRGRTLCWTSFVLFVFGVGIHTMFVDAYLTKYLFWW